MTTATDATTDRPGFLSRLASDGRVLRAMARRGPGDVPHQSRLDEFYRPQSRDYDRFRERLLAGRLELITGITVRPGAVWIDLGGGTGRTLEFLGPDLATLSRVYLVDVADSLLEVARRRVASLGWTNVTILLGDSTSVDLPAGSADVVIFSYALTMMPDWFRAIDHARRLLKPGGLIGVVDFYVSRKHAAPLAQHGAATRWFTRAWFSHCDVFPSPDHLPYLCNRFERVHLHEGRSRLPYLPGVRVPYFRFIGRRPSSD